MDQTLELQLLMRSYYVLLPFTFFFSIQSATGQSIELKFAEFRNNKVVVHYSLLDSVNGRTYTVRLYVSKDNFLNPLEKVSGDIGLEVKGGPDNTIWWDACEELSTSFDGTIALEIRGRTFIPFINTESINQYKVFKRAREYNLTWSGGTPQNILNFDLYQGERKITTFPNLANVGHHTLQFPSHVNPGKGYRFRISDSKNKEEVVYTAEFKVKRKIPLLIKVVPVAIIGSALYLLLQPKNVEPDLPVPPVKQ